MFTDRLIVAVVRQISNYVSNLGDIGLNLLRDSDSHPAANDLAAKS